MHYVVSKDKFEWDKNAARKTRCQSPETDGANVAVGTTHSEQSRLEIKAHGNSAFQWTAKVGPLLQENMRGARLDIKL